LIERSGVEYHRAHESIPFPELGIELLVHALDRPATRKATAGAGTLLLRAP
jgi:hypothetical protein